MSGARLNHVNGLSTSGTVGLFPRTSSLVKLVDQTYFFTVVAVGVRQKQRPHGGIAICQGDHVTF